jgi:hypothetical protein
MNPNSIPVHTNVPLTIIAEFLRVVKEKIRKDQLGNKILKIVKFIICLFIYARVESSWGAFILGIKFEVVLLCLIYTSKPSLSLWYHQILKCFLLGLAIAGTVYYGFTHDKLAASSFILAYYPLAELAFLVYGFVRRYAREGAGIKILKLAGIAILLFHYQEYKDSYGDFLVALFFELISLILIIFKRKQEMVAITTQDCDALHIYNINADNCPSL